MPFVRVNNYTDISFTNEKPLDYYKYVTISELEKICDPNIEEGIKVHCIGVIYSEHGIFYLKSLPQNKTQNFVRISVVYLLEAPRCPSIPSTVQVFGDLIWKKRPVILARMLNYMLPNKAIMLENSMGRIRRSHLANHKPTNEMELD